MTPEELKKLLAVQSAKFKNITGAASDKEINILKDTIPQSDLDAKFITERTGAAVSEEELEMLKKLIPNK